MATLAPSSAWYLIHTKPKQEHVALDHLSRQGYGCYLPRIQKERMRLGRLETVWEPLFARYLFVDLDHPDYNPNWGPIQSTQGVTRLVRFGNQAAKIDAHWIQAFKEREQQTPVQPLFKFGDMVRITQGPYAGLEALYQKGTAAQRALVLFELLGKPVKLNIPSCALRQLPV